MIGLFQIRNSIDYQYDYCSIIVINTQYLFQKILHIRKQNIEKN